MNNFWNNTNRPTGSLFGKKSGVVPQPTPPPPPPAASKPDGSKSAKGNAAAPPAADKNAKPAAGPAGKIKFDHDFACGVFVGAFDIPSMSVTVEMVEVTDPVSQKVERYERWLRTNDMLAILTREFGKARAKLEAIPPPAVVAGRPVGAKDWDEATRRVNEVRDQVVCLLHSRRAYHRAKDQGIRVLIEA